MLNISIPKNPDLNKISSAISQLLKLGHNVNNLINEDILYNLNPKQFIFLISIAAFEGKNFKQNMFYIKKYIKSLPKNNLELLLNLEAFLHSFFLKKYETNEAYNEFYSFFSELYVTKKRKNFKIKNINNILFYVHQPVFLAHTNPLFFLIENRKNNYVKISIASNNTDVNFENKCKTLGISFHNINDKSIIQSMSKLKKLALSHDIVVWQSVPLHLSYFRSIFSNVSYWSHKFHPNISNLRSYIASFNFSEKKQIRINGNIWENIDVGFEINNLHTKKHNWSKRKLKFGSFCREELIDYEKYWEKIKLILTNNVDSRFFYCGRTEIHSKWCQKLNLNTKRIFFLGWLEQPHFLIKEMSFILDGDYLGHGYMALEAMAAGVPIIVSYNRKTKSMFENQIKRYSHKLDPKQINNYLKKFLLIYKNNKDLINITNQLLTSLSYNSFYGNEYIKIVKNIKNASFEDFIKVL